MRPQTTAYIHLDSKAWLTDYAKQCGLSASEVVRLLVEREQQVRWLEWALQTPDPGRSRSKPLKGRKDRLPRRWDNPPR
jgi:hypothetical protein